MRPSTPGTVKCCVPALSARNADGFSARRCRICAARCWSDCRESVGFSGRVCRDGPVVVIAGHEFLVGGVCRRLEGDPEGLEEVAEDGAVSAEVDGQGEQGPLGPDE